MLFKEKLRRARTEAHLTQEALAGRLHLSKRTIEGYESGDFYPKNRRVYDDLADIFGVDRNWFLSEETESAAETAAGVVKTVQSLYAGGALSEADKDALARALMDAYWIAVKKRDEHVSSGK